MCLCSGLVNFVVFIDVCVVGWLSVLFAELAVGNIVRRVLHIIREEDLSLTTAAIAGLDLSAASDGDDDDDGEQDEHTVLSAAAVAASARNALRPPSLQTLLEDMPESVAIPHTSSSGGDSEGKSKCKSLMVVQSFYVTASYHMADYHML